MGNDLQISLETDTTKVHPMLIKIEVKIIW